MIDHADLWNSATRRNDRPRPLESARCSLCGAELPKGLMMPDGGGACADVRWYCKDTRSCTDRWTARPDEAPAPEKGAEQRAAEEADQAVEAVEAVEGVPGQPEHAAGQGQESERVPAEAERSPASGGT
jgi:hypothetical protein